MKAFWFTEKAASFNIILIGISMCIHESKFGYSAIRNINWAPRVKFWAYEIWRRGNPLNWEICYGHIYLWWWQIEAISLEEKYLQNLSTCFYLPSHLSRYSKKSIHNFRRRLSMTLVLCQEKQSISHSIKFKDNF